jgi:hypothetical protein
MLPASKGKPEFDLLCLVARPRPTLERVRDLVQSGLDFSELNQLAEQHSVRPRLIDVLGRLSWARVPAETREALEDFQHRHLLRALSLAEALCRVTAEFAGAGIPFATFKGVALATSLYGDVSAREYDDIDIVVPRERMADAERVLARLGYRGIQGDRSFRQAFLGHQRQFTLAHTERDIDIDLHWAFSGSFLPFPVTPDDVWRDAAHVAIAGQSVPTLAGANLALLLAGHGTKERWHRLGWVADFALLIARDDHVDWSGVYERARGHGCGAAVLLGCLLARDLLDVPVPQQLSELVAGNDRVRARAATLIERMRKGAPEPEIAANFSDLDLCDRRLDRLKAVLGLTLTPTPGDYAAMPLPPALWSLYYATRPFRLAAKAASAMFTSR